MDRQQQHFIVFAVIGTMSKYIVYSLGVYFGASAVDRKREQFLGFHENMCFYLGVGGGTSVPCLSDACFGWRLAHTVSVCSHVEDGRWQQQSPWAFVYDGFFCQATPLLNHTPPKSTCLLLSFCLVAFAWNSQRWQACARSGRRLRSTVASPSDPSTVRLLPNGIHIKGSVLITT